MYVIDEQKIIDWAIKKVSTSYIVNNNTKLIKQKINIMKGMTDWNKLTMEHYIEHLEEKFKFDSSGTAKAVFELIAGYRALSIQRVSKRFSEMEEAGKEATSLIAHLKDQYGFNDVEEEAQDKIMSVFEYEGRW